MFTVWNSYEHIPIFQHRSCFCYELFRASDRPGHDAYDSMIVSMVVHNKVFTSFTQQLPVISAQKARQQITAAVSVFFQLSCS